MRLICLALSVLAPLSAATSRVAAHEGPHPPKGYVALFNGEDLAGWHGMGHFDPYKLQEMSDEERAAKREADTKDAHKHWSVENGELVNDGHGAYLTTNKNYKSFDLWLDYKTVAQADSGVYLRATPQVQIWDTTEAGGKWNIGAKEGSGSLWNNKKEGHRALVHADKPFGEWNRMRITMTGEYVTVYLNGKLVVDHVPLENFWRENEPVIAEGPIQLQTHGGEIRWKNVYLREIPEAEAKQINEQRAAQKEAGETPREVASY